jgi:hypothetical protein
VLCDILTEGYSLLLELAILQLGMLGEDEVDKGVEVSYNIYYVTCRLKGYSLLSAIIGPLGHTQVTKSRVDNQISCMV